jgi:hypothetical protein
VAWSDDGWGDGGDFYDDESPDIKDILFGDAATMDAHAQELFVSAVFDGDDKAYIDLVDYMWTEYNIDFEDVFDWEDFQDWYDAQ